MEIILPKKTLFNQKIYSIRLVVAFSLICFLIYSTGWDRFWATMTRISPFWGVLAVFASFFLFLVSNLNLWILLKALCPISFTEFFRQYVYGFIVTLFVPGQMGDASITLFLKREGIPVRQSGVAYLLDKTITLLVYLTVCSWGAGLLVPTWNVWWLKVLPLAAFIFLWTIIFYSLKFLSRLSRYPKVRQWLMDFHLSLQIYQRHWGLALVNLLVACLKWGAVSLCYFFAFLSFRQIVSWPVIGILPILSSLAGYIPVSLGGIGITEAAAVYLFSLQGVDQAVVLSAYIFLRLIQFFIAACILAILKKPFEGNRI